MRRLTLKKQLKVLFTEIVAGCNHCRVCMNMCYV